MTNIDDIYNKPVDQIVDFAFDASVVGVFPDMIRRSVPGYEVMVPMTGLMAARALGEQGRAYDLGCSLGATTLAILKHNASPNIEVIGVDSSEPMIEGARRAIDDPRAQFLCADIDGYDLDGADVVIFNLVLQFLDPERRLELLKSVRTQMNPSAILLVSEKVRNDDAQIHDLFDQHHLDFKRANGYSELEISQKRNAIENVMRIDSEEQHRQRFHDAGFNTCIQWYRCLNWASFFVR